MTEPMLAKLASQLPRQVAAARAAGVRLFVLRRTEEVDAWLETIDRPGEE